FTDAIKSGDSGRIILSLKTFALSFRGCGRTKYAGEMQHVIHNYTHIWPKPLRTIILNNWLVSTTGYANSFIPLDLLQERMNFWIKKISPCTDVLRQLATGTHMNDSLGSKLGRKHHTPDISKDIREILDSLRTKAVYEVQLGRTVDTAKAEVPNIDAAGFRALAGPLQEHNERFERLRERYREAPLVGSGT
ncbi:hypothetical protein BC629DRAFT_1262098, partial [Irpex lacteus]